MREPTSATPSPAGRVITGGRVAGGRITRGRIVGRGITGGRVIGRGVTGGRVAGVFARPRVWAAVIGCLLVAGVVLPVRLGTSREPEPAGLPASATPAQVLGLAPRDTVTEAAGEPVVGAEVLRSADVVRPEVIAEFTGGGVAAGSGFWDRPLAGVTARDRLRERALAAAVRDKVRRIWAREAGLVEEVSEAAFQRALALENGRREAARRAGRPLPGVPRYDEYTYAQVSAAELDYALSERLAGKLDLSESRLRAHYGRLSRPGAPSFADARDDVRRSLVAEEYARALDGRVAAALGTALRDNRRSPA
ncbi:hypothetical protein ACQPYK_18105 [Streptosporangium sp. CA-135522]|uniref:hypothetical protein n=1 Tax=Streptosporangium sp. CA-135522 TaxID=3240072 RepID=UPI003D910791